MQWLCILYVHHRTKHMKREQRMKPSAELQATLWKKLAEDLLSDFSEGFVWNTTRLFIPMVHLIGMDKQRKFSATSTKPHQFVILTNIFMRGVLVSHGAWWRPYAHTTNRTKYTHIVRTRWFLVWCIQTNVLILYHQLVFLWKIACFRWKIPRFLPQSIFLLKLERVMMQFYF